MDLKTYYGGLSEADRKSFADRAGTTTRYIEIHLLSPLQRRKIPRPKLMDGLMAASNGEISRNELLDYFYPRGDRRDRTRADASGDAGAAIETQPAAGAAKTGTDA